MGKLKGIKVAILATNGFEQAELEQPRKALIDAGAEAFIISPEKNKIQGYNHMEKADLFSVDKTLDEVKAEEFDAIVLPGGVINPDQLRIIPKAIAFVKEFNRQGKPIAAICHGPWLLINAQLINNSKITSWPSLKQDLINAGGTWVDEPVVCHDNLITSRNPDDIPHFNAALINMLEQGL